MSKLVIKNLKKKFKDKVILDIEHIEFDSKNLNVIQGSNGSGKTTFLLEILTVNNCNQNISFVNESNESLEIKREDILYIPPKGSLISYYTIKDNLNFFEKNDVHEFLNRFNIDENSSVIELSGGEEEIVSVFRIRNIQNKIILLDEVTSYLDDKNFEIIFNIIKNLLLKNNLVIFATHDTRVLNRTEKIIKLRDGKFVD